MQALGSIMWQDFHPQHSGQGVVPKITVLEVSKRKNKKGENKDLGLLSFIASLIAGSDVLPQGSCVITTIIYFNQ